MLQTIISIPENFYASVKGLTSEVKALCKEIGAVGKLTQEKKDSLKERAYSVALKVLGLTLMTTAVVSLGFTAITGTEVACAAWLFLSVITDIFILIVGHDFCLIGANAQKTKEKMTLLSIKTDTFPDLEPIIGQWIAFQATYVKDTLFIGPITTNLHEFAKQNGMYETLKSTVDYINEKRKFFSFLSIG